MDIKGIARASLSVLCFLVATASSVAGETYTLPSRFAIDLLPGADVGRVVRVLESQGIKVVGSAEMPDGPAVWVDIDPRNPPSIKALRPLLPEVQSYAPDVARKLLAHGASYTDVALNGEVWPWGAQAVLGGQLAMASDRKVCIIDTGYAWGHPDLQTTRVAGTDRGAGKWDASDGMPLHMHGTHVAGTIAAIGGNGLGVAGVIPGGNLDLFIVRAFDADGLFIYAGELVVAMQDCADAGANVISMSLGGAFASRAEERMIAKLIRKGILLVAAAGNEGTSVFSYPASYKGVLSVAAVDSRLQHAAFSQRNTRVDVAAPGVDVRSTVPPGAAFVPHLVVGGVEYASRTMEGSPKISVAAPLADFGQGDKVDLAMAGKACLVQRGTVDFFTKVVNCQSSGGVSAIIYNNVPGEFNGGLGIFGSFTSIPALSTSDDVGSRLGRQLGSMASIDFTADDYSSLDGTSMAVPHVTAVAALVWSHFPGCTANHVRDALRQSAHRLTASGNTDHFTGHGLVQARAAFDYLSANPCRGAGSEHSR